MSGDHNKYHMKVEVVKDKWKYDPETGEPLINGYPLHSGLPNRKRQADFKIGAWLSAALEDPSTCQSMKDDINEWFECTPQLHSIPMQIEQLIEALEEAVHFIVPTEKDMQRRAEVRRIVKALEMLKERNEKRETS